MFILLKIMSPKRFHQFTYLCINMAIFQIASNTIIIQREGKWYLNDVFKNYFKNFLIFLFSLATHRAWILVSGGGIRPGPQQWNNVLIYISLFIVLVLSIFTMFLFIFSFMSIKSYFLSIFLWDYLYSHMTYRRYWEFIGFLVVKTLSFHWWGPRFNLWSGN